MQTAKLITYSSQIQFSFLNLLSCVICQLKSFVLNISQEGGDFLLRLKKVNVKEAECAFSNFRNETSLFIILWGKARNTELPKQ
jgi:hypothetical protein